MCLMMWEMVMKLRELRDQNNKEFQIGVIMALNSVFVWLKYIDI